MSDQFPSGSILIDPARLQQWLPDPDLRLFDVRYSLQSSEAGQEQYWAGHIPGAYYASTSHDLAAPVLPGKTGRHPLPSREAFQETLRHWGVSEQSHIVLYDDGSHFFVSRLWWMLSVWLEHPSVYILHGGLRHWQEQGGAITQDLPDYPASSLQVELNDSQLLTAEHVPGFVGLGGALVDARAEERFRGEVEPLDPKAGHIPGAVCSPCSKVTDEHGYFLSPDVLRRHFSSYADRDVACYCGSGISACQNILAMVLAGLPVPKLYAGSWSEWVTDPSRPVATG